MSPRITLGSALVAATAWGAVLTFASVAGLLTLSNSVAWDDGLALAFGLTLAPFGAVVGWTTARIARDSSGAAQ